MTPEGGWSSTDLIETAKAGDAGAIAAVVSNAHPHVQRFARSLCGSPQDAEDAAQEALIILYRKIGSLRASGALASWMFRIVRNECLRRSRSMLRRRDLQARFDGEPAPEQMSAEDEVLHRLDADRVAAAIAGLPSMQRRVLIMRDVQGLPGQSVADLLGLSLPAMKSNLHRARASVQSAVSPF